MKAVILAAGLGKRLRPLTFFRAKAVMPLLNIPLLIYTINFLKKRGIKDIIINLHHLPDTIKRELNIYKNSEINIEWSYEPDILGTAGALKKVQDSLGKDTFCVINGDILFDFDIKKALEFHQAKKALATMIVLPYPSEKYYSSILLDNNSMISQIGEEGRGAAKKSGKWMFSGVQILEPDVFRYIVKEGFSDSIKDFYIPAITNGEPIFGYGTSDFWQEIGSPNDYLEAHARLVSFGSLKIYNTWDVECTIKNREYTGSQSDIFSAKISCDRTVDIREEVIIKEWAVLGQGCRIGEECIIDKSIFFNDCVVGEKSYLSNSILLDSVQIPPQSDIRDAIVIAEDSGSKKISIISKV